LGGKGRPARKADNDTISEPIVWKMWEAQRLTTLRAFTACYRDSFTFTIILLNIGLTTVIILLSIVSFIILLRARVSVTYSTGFYIG
jgi:hypothetical protein